MTERFERIEGRAKRLEGRMKRLEGRTKRIEGRAERIERNVNLMKYWMVGSSVVGAMVVLALFKRMDRIDRKLAGL